MKIPFNKPFLIGKELQYIQEAVDSGKISGDGIFTKKCHRFFEENYGFRKVMLTTSCTDALEMAALLIDVQAGDEIIIPSYTFVSTANAFVLRGAKIIFCDSNTLNPNMDANQLEPLITSRTKAIVPVHYAGIACDMESIMQLATKYNLFVVEDAAQSIDSYYENKILGSIGHLSAFSFHETKNIISGEGGMLAINDEQFFCRAEIIREKGTNRSQYFRGEVDKYGWVDIGSSFLPSELTSAFLYAQLENLKIIQSKRLKIWNRYWDNLHEKAIQLGVLLPSIPKYASCNAHMFYLVCKDIEQRTGLIEHLKANNILAVFHYQSLHKSTFYSSKHDGRELPNCDRYSDCLLRLPLYYDLSLNEVDQISDIILNYLDKYERLS